jgi:hypothetical protein
MRLGARAHANVPGDDSQDELMEKPTDPRRAAPRGGLIDSYADYNLGEGDADDAAVPSRSRAVGAGAPPAAPLAAPAGAQQPQAVRVPVPASVLPGDVLEDELMAVEDELMAVYDRVQGPQHNYTDEEALAAAMKMNRRQQDDDYVYSDKDE